MTEYIDREAAAKLLRHQAREALEYSNTECEVLYSVADELEDFPPADVVQVVHGKWVNPRWAMKYPHGVCSECGWVNRTGAHCAGFRLRFCPACGAKMDVEGLNDETD